MGSVIPSAWIHPPCPAGLPEGRAHVLPWPTGWFPLGMAFTTRPILLEAWEVERRHYLSIYTYTGSMHRLIAPSCSYVRSSNTMHQLLEQGLLWAH